MNKTHIIYIPFTGVGTNRILTDEWLADRIEIFKNYTLKSLLNQTNQDFVLWLSFRPEEQSNSLVWQLVAYLNTQEITFFCSYYGLMYFDDRNEEQTKTLKDRLTSQLNLMKLQMLEDDFKDWIYLTRIDSDDMFHKDVVQLIQDQEPFEGALTLQLGYVYNKDTQEVAEWNPLTNPPFHTIIMDRATFFDPVKHLNAYRGFKSHEDIAKLNHKVLWRGDNRRDRLYMVLTHNPKMHISTTWDHEFKGKLVNIDLSDFGIDPTNSHINGTFSETKDIN